jgi:hypothetical protein
MATTDLTTILGAEAVPDATALKRYTKAKQALAREVRGLKRLFAEGGTGRAADACQDLIVRLAEDRFTLALMGQFKRGKSSLMNAVIGRALLPTGVLPLTSAITVLRYGPQERLIIHRDAAQFAEETPVWRLAEYVTEKGNPGNQKKVRTACVELPLAFLRRGLEFVDTPGVGSAIEANTATAYAFLPQCDAVLFVTSVDTPLTKTEIEFVGRIREHVRKVFFIVNKTDLLAEAEREEVLRFVADTLRTHVGGQPIRVLPLSCRLGLAAKMAGDADGYAASGLKALEETLAAFLAREKAATLLSSVIDKALRLLAEGAGCTEKGRAIGERLAGLRARVTDEALPEVEPAAPPAGAAPVPPPPEPVPAAIREADLVQDLQTRGCPVCQRMGRAAADFFAQWQYALSSDEAAQVAFAAESGFCPLHAWQLFALSSPQGTSQGYPKLVERLASEIAQLAATPAAVAQLPRVPDSGNCRVCGLLRAVEKAYIQRLAGFLQTAEGRGAYAQSQGVCLRHLGLTAAAVASEDGVRFLLAEAARHLEEVAEDMQNFAMKREAIRRTLHNRDEEDAYVRAVIHLVGESRVCIPWMQDAEI